MDTVPTLSNLTDVFDNFIKAALGFAGIALFIMLIVGGVKFITSGGDPKAAESAQKTITYAIGGLILILFSYMILVLIYKITGVDVTNFQVTQ